MAGFRSLRSRARAVRILIGLLALADVARIAAELHRAGLVGRVAQDPLSVTTPQLVRSDHLANAAAVAFFVAFVALIVVFLMWFARATRNLRVLSADEPRYSPVAAVVAWFIPFVTLVRPKKAANDAWRAGAPLYVAPPALLNWWWAAWVFDGLASRALSGVGDNGTTAGIEASDRAVAVGSAIDLLALALLFAVVALITQRQHARAVEAAGRATAVDAAPAPAPA